MCCGAAQTVLETGAPISWDSSQNVERLDGGRSSRAERSERGESCLGMGTAPAGEWAGDNGTGVENPHAGLSKGVMEIGESWE